jgi:predicted  nucleic acid-binding Zn-ribbon protein
MEGQISLYKARAKQAKDQAEELEDKLQSVEKELAKARGQIELLERCGQDRDRTVADLERRLQEESKQHSQAVSENETKMTKIKEWVTSKLDGVSTYCGGCVNVLSV